MRQSSLGNVEQERAELRHRALRLGGAVRRAAQREASDEQCDQHDGDEREVAPRDAPLLLDGNHRRGAQDVALDDRLAEAPTVRRRRGNGLRGERRARRVDELGCAAVSVLRTLREPARDHVVEPCRQVGPEVACPRRGLVQVRVQERCLVVVREDDLAGQRLVHHRGERIQVGTRAVRLAADLLRRGVVERARVLARHRHAALARALGQAEVREERVVVVVDEDVLRLHVAVHEP